MIHASPKVLKAMALSMMISCFSLADGQGSSKIIVVKGAQSELFGPGIISTGNEWAPSFTPDGKTVYFTRGPGVIYFSKLVNGKLSTAKVAAFSGKWRDMDPFVSPDGSRLFFSSYRPVNSDPNGEAPKFAHIWYVDYLGDDNWSVPHHLEAPVNLEGISNYAPSITV
jgi:Tol biopolymer transport system component